MNLSDFSNDLSSECWQNVLLETDAKSAYDIWYRQFCSVLDKHAPLRGKKSAEKRNPWINNDILNKIGKINKPSSNVNDFIDSINSVLNVINRQSKTCFIMGDFNLDMLRYIPVQYDT